MQSCRYGWEQLTTAQQYLLEHALGLGPAREERRTQVDKWMLNLRAAQAFHAREGHLRVPRKHEEQLAGEEAGGAQETAEGFGSIKLGMWVANVRKRAGKLTPERRAALDAIGMEWTAGTARRGMS